MVIVIGTGAGGALLARELAKDGKKVTILEKGPYIDSKDAFNYYDAYSNDVDLLTTTCIGGATIVSMSNMVRALDANTCDIVGSRRVDRRGEPPIRSFFARAFYQ